MGVPAFFRWLHRKYPEIVVHCVEEKPKDVAGTKVPVDCSRPNPNGYEFDNLYLDMNGIIHPCSHPEDKPAPKDEAEMMVNIFEYIDRIFSICRPRRLLYMAIDGVAPRAKMNQQRSRRFRAAKESREAREAIAKIKARLREKGAKLPAEEEKKEHFDSNCITPGTEFMDRLSVCLRYYITDRLTNHPGWKNIKVILSDANTPGEGEHKIMDYIRRQRAQPSHDPNTKHCLNGADADLIMLGLATHEAHFTIIREEFIPNQPKPCEICAQVGHEKERCQGLPKNGHGVPQPFVGADVEFIFIRLHVLREYLEKDLKMNGIPFGYKFDRVLDDWVFICFFVGNDFLPHLPSLDIREGGIDKLVGIYKQCLPRMGGYLAENGYCNLKRVQMVLIELGKMEDQIFQQRQESEPPDLKNMSISNSGKRGFQAPGDSIRLYEAGWKDRYYLHKFGVSRDRNPAFFTNFAGQVANEYVLGLAWVLLYYYQGCPSWNWFYPFHYAPFASDFLAIDKVNTNFEKGTKPFNPLEQLMSVFPAASGKFLPPTWREKMTSADSEIIDFYPLDFKVDLNGKRWAWQGVALLPFVDEKRLHRTLANVYGDLTDDEKRRNRRDEAVLFVGKANPMFDFLRGLNEKKMLAEKLGIVTKLSMGMAGKVYEDIMAVPSGSKYPCPVPNMSDLETTAALSVRYIDPLYDINYVFPCVALKNVIPPKCVLKSNDFAKNQHKNQRNSSYESPGGSSRGSGGPRSYPGTPQSLLGSPIQFTPSNQVMRQSSPYNSGGSNSPSPAQYFNNNVSPLHNQWNGSANSALSRQLFGCNQSYGGNQSFNSPQSPYGNNSGNCRNNNFHSYNNPLPNNQSIGSHNASFGQQSFGSNQTFGTNQLFNSPQSPYGNNSGNRGYYSFNNSYNPQHNSNQYLNNSLSPLLGNPLNGSHNSSFGCQPFGGNQSFGINQLFNSPRSPYSNTNGNYGNYSPNNDIRNNSMQGSRNYHQKNPYR